VRAVPRLALAESAQPLLFCGRGLPLPFLRWPDACGFLRLFVRPLDAYASPKPAARPLRVEAAFSAAARRFAALRFRVAAAFCPAVLRMGLMFPPASSCGTALNPKFIRHASTTIFTGGVNCYGLLDVATRARVSQSIREH